MAIYHLNMSVISRKAGRSSTAAAAYRSATKIVDQRTGLTFDYTKKAGVVSAELILPAGAPADLVERSALWNAVEAKNRRADAQVAREITIALPAELSAGDRADLAREFSRHIADTYSVGVDLAIHMPSAKGSDLNHHAHLLLTTNRLDAAGLGNKVRELDPIAHGMNKQQREKKNAVEVLRECWADLVNAKLERAGRFDRVDHRSHRERGIEDEPTIHVGPTGTEMERCGEVSDRAQVNESIRHGNAERRRLAKEVAETEDRVKAIRRSQQAREQARRQQSPGPVPAHGSTAVAQGASRTTVERLLGIDAVAQALGIPSREQRQAEAEKQRAEKAARDRALAGLAKFRRIVEPRAAEIAARAADNATQIQVSQQRVIDEQREHAAVRPQAPGAISRMVGGGGRYQRDMAVWESKADELDDTARRLRESFEAERRDHANAWQTAARELARSNPDLVMLAKKGQAIEERERKERETERQRQREAKREERRQAQLEQAEKRRILKQTREAERQQQTAREDQVWAKDGIDQLLAGVSDRGEQARILAGERQQWLRDEPRGEARREWREYGAALDARITALDSREPGNEQTREGQRQAEGPRRRSRGPGM